MICLGSITVNILHSAKFSVDTEVKMHSSVDTGMGGGDVVFRSGVSC